MPRVSRVGTATALAVVLSASCGDGTNADSGNDAALQVAGATFFRGAPSGDASGLAVASLDLGTDSAVAGARGKPVRGALAVTASAVALGITGDVGYWVVRAREPQIDAPDLPSFSTTLAFAKGLAPGDYELVAHAVAPGGAFGPATSHTVRVAQRGAAAGRLVVTLSWANEADLDLRVVDPSGVEISKGNINSYSPPAPGDEVDPHGPENGGILDTDSNAKCVIDALDTENVIWQNTPPSGHYLVRVDTFSMCSANVAPWRVVVTFDGNTLAQSAGESIEWDTRSPHDTGAGLLAAEFDVP